ncbi:hypothetical protein [Halothermothrix orenii]|uniref:hypothetical protein n=1 Tax=Halothermothrix orenii TaxID=31909 RepID=UPI00030737EA|nr:hypothetical protein [Halothermothrix orenii]
MELKSLKLGDLVLKKDSSYGLVYQITGFDGNFIILKGIKIPIITICTADELIKINRTRKVSNNSIRCIK